jgi:hypothetical protein
LPSSNSLSRSSIRTIFKSNSLQCLATMGVGECLGVWGGGVGAITRAEVLFWSPVGRSTSEVYFLHPSFFFLPGNSTSIIGSIGGGVPFSIV